MAEVNFKKLKIHNPMAKLASQEQNVTLVDGSVKFGKHNYFFLAHVHEEPVENGIDGGKVDMLAIFKRGLLVANYRKHWDIFPSKSSHKKVLGLILDCFNEN